MAVAHRRSDGKCQPLKQHLRNVAEMAAEFAKPFNSADWARLAGVWHDLGKYSDAFQDYLRSVTDSDSHQSEIVARIDHTSAGAQYAVAASEILGHLLAYVIAGHHTGLLNGRDTGACLEKRLRKKIEEWNHGLNELSSTPFPAIPSFLGVSFSDKEYGAFSVSFFVRMIFSCLVDADFLDTEQFMDTERADSRPSWPDDMLFRMEKALDQYMKRLSGKDTPVNRERHSIRKACLDAALKNPGLFTLTVPTGGGKTLASLAFALSHAQHFGMDRIIYVIPFTSIIEQNANVFRDAMSVLEGFRAEDVVLEHHSNFDPDKETTRTRLMTENWDTPLVVTTSVQFYESLFASKTSRCRKLHRMANAVIILDEVQTLPVDYLKPCLVALKELAANYKSTIVLCTATQPAIGKRDNFPIGLDLSSDREIMPDPKSLYQRLQRVTVVDLGKQTDAQTSERMLSGEQSLCIVNTRKHARLIYEALGNAKAHFHLSALMCPMHRNAVLDTIRHRLERGMPCRVVSTQLIEAGVDVDFPVVFRSVAGVDSIAQAAGRCNRNGTLQGKGKTYIFRSEHHSSERFFSETANCAEAVLELHDDPLSLEAVEHFFKLYYWDQSARWDKKQIMQDYHLLQDRQFPFSFSFDRTAREFHLIDQHSKPVIIPWKDKGRKLCERLRAIPQPYRILRRKLQRYTVQIPERLWNEHLHKSFDWVHDQFAVLISPDLHYSDQFGLCLDTENVDSEFWVR